MILTTGPVVESGFDALVVEGPIASASSALSPNDNDAGASVVDLVFECEVVLFAPEDGAGGAAEDAEASAVFEVSIAAPSLCDCVCRLLISTAFDGGDLSCDVSDRWPLDGGSLGAEVVAIAGRVNESV